MKYYINTNMEEHVQKLILDGKNVLLTGSAGTGKTFLLSKIINNNENILVTASTGIAALNINGETLHSAFCMTPEMKTSGDIISALKKKQNILKKEKILSSNILIIDEVSMIGRQLLKRVHTVLSKIRKSNELFGGMQIIICGDFCQLKPINDEYCFNSSMFHTFVVVNLTQPFRQKDDIPFFNLLERSRFGELSQDDICELQRLLISQEELISLIEDDFIAIFPINKSVNMLNKRMFKQISRGKEKHTFHREEFGCGFENPFDEKNIPESIELCEGCIVMVTRNISPETPNGLRGKVIKIDNDEMINDYEETNFVNTVWIKTAFATHKIQMMFETIGNTSVRFMPLKLAYAITTHKSQGLTFKKVVVDIGNDIFADGQAYVALSRARSLSDIKLINFSPEVFKQNKCVEEFYNALPK